MRYLIVKTSDGRYDWVDKEGLTQEDLLFFDDVIATRSTKADAETFVTELNRREHR